KGLRWTQDDPTGYPANSWSAGDVVIQSFNLIAPADAPPGQYAINLGFYVRESGQRLPQIMADGNVGPDNLMLHPLNIVAAEHPPHPSELPIVETTDADFGGRLTLLGYTLGTRVLNLA